MKIRNGFVTNSSSSSFILAFTDEKDREQFEEGCKWSEYDNFLNLIKSFEKDKENTDKQIALDVLRHHYIWGFQWDFLDARIQSCDYTDYKNYIKARDELLQSDECIKYVEEKLAETDYEQKKKQIEDADTIVMGTIWDTSGGLLEWAIRNGFIEDNFYKYCVDCWNVG